MNNSKQLIYDLSKDEITELILQWGYERFRSNQIWEGLYKHQWQAVEEFSILPTRLREEISEKFIFDVLSQRNKLSSEDLSTEKYLFGLQDDLAIETVLMRYRERNTVCISTQVGCGLDCKFCATGRMGFKRNLTSGEIVSQVMLISKKLSLESEKLSNVVIMGMGEPFLNYENTLKAIAILNEKSGFNFGSRRFTISTVGIVPKILRFAMEKHQMNLAISLHAADDSLRSKLLPINKKYPIDDVLSACEEYIEITHRRVSLEWALIDGINDTTQQATTLAKRIKGKNFHVNLIPLNISTFFSGESSPIGNVNEFKKIIEASGISCSVRVRRGIDIQAGCGQLMDDSDE